MRSCAVIVGLLVAGVSVIGCSWGKRPPINGDPTATGMVILDATFEIGASGDEWDRLMISEEDSRTIGGVITRRQDALERTGTMADDRVVVFADLPPGRYTVVALSASREFTRAEVQSMYKCSGKNCPWAMEIDLILDPETRRTLTVDVGPGEVVYAGRVFFHEPHTPPFNEIRPSLVSEHAIDYHLHRSDRSPPRVTKSESAEYAALKGVLSSYRKGPWTVVIRRRIEALRKLLVGTDSKAPSSR